MQIFMIGSERVLSRRANTGMGTPRLQPMREANLRRKVVGLRIDCAPARPALDRYSRLVVPQKLGDLEEPGASVAQIRAYFDGLVRDLLSPEGRQGCLLINSAIENAAVDPEVAAVVRGHMARLERCFTGALRTAIDLGEIPALVNVTAVAKGLVATASGLMVVGKANPDEEVLRIIVDNAFAGLM